MSMPKRALPSSSSAGQPSQPKRPCFSPLDRGWNGSEANLMRCCCLTKEDVRSVCTEVLEHSKSDWAKYVESCFRNVLKDVVQQVLSENDFQRLKEAVQSTKSHSPNLGRGNAECTTNNGARNLQLQLLTKPSLPLFTGKKIEGEDGACICVALIDTNTGEVVMSGPESSIKLDVVVLEGDFNKDDEDNWTPEELENYMVKQRKGKGPLLAGEPVVKLKEGMGELGELIITDNSSWNRSKRFRIAFKVASGFCGKTRIREAITDAFPVKEHRGEAYRKHHPPKSDDEVWRLENIAKDGKSHQKLSEAGINKVEDFLLQLFTDPKKVRGILGKSITEKKWDSLVRHAKTCKYCDGMTKHGAAFNTDGQPIGLIRDGEYFTTHQLSAQEKEHGDTTAKKALANWHDVSEFSSETFSDSMEKNSSSSFSSQLFDGQTENSVQRYLVPPILVAPNSPEPPLANVSSIAAGLNHATALALPFQSQSTISGNAMEISANENFPLASHQPMSAYRSSVLTTPEYHGSTSAGWPTQSHGINLQNAMRRKMIDSLSQMDYAGCDDVLPSDPSCSSIIQSRRTFPLPEINHVMEDLRSINPDYFDELFADTPPYNETFHNGAVRGANRGVHGWLKIKAVLQWGFFTRKTGVRLVQLDQPPIKVQACP